MKLLSMLLCVAMLLSGFAFAEAPAAAASVVTIRDIVVSLQDQEYPLNPSLFFGAHAGENSALLDLGMNLGEDVLFPVQTKIDENGVAVLLGNSKTAYTFSPEFFTSVLGDEVLSNELFSIGASYAELVDALNGLDTTAPVAMDDSLTKYATVTETENVEFTVGDQTLTGTQYVFEVDPDQMREYLDVAFAQLPAEFTEAYFGFLNTMTAMTGEPEITSFGELMDYNGMQMSLSGTYTGDNTCGTGEMTYHILIDPAAFYGTEAEYIEDETTEVIVKEEPVETEEAAIGVIGGADGPTSVFVVGDPVVMDMPMQFTVYSPEEFSLDMTMNFDGVDATMSMTQIGEDFNGSVAYDIPYVGSVAVDFAQDAQEDGSTLVNANLNADLGDALISALTDSVASDNGSVTNVQLGYTSEDFNGSVAFVVEESTAAIEDRIAAANSKVIGSMEDAESSVGLIAAALGLAGDAEPLVNDESISALINAVTDLLYVNMTEAYEEEYTEEYSEAATPTITEPALTWLPEGYTITESSFDAEYGNYSCTLLHENDTEYESAVYVTVYAIDNSYMTTNNSYYTLNDGAAASVDGTLVYVYNSYDPEFPYTNAYAYYDTYTIDVSTYGSYLTEADMINIIAGVTFAE